MNPMVQQAETRTALPHILVIDNDPDSTPLLSRVLGPQYRFTTARTGEEALYLLQNQSFDLILLDVLLRKTCRPDILATVRNNTSTVHLPVILISTLSMRHDVLRGLENGANDYITKPFDLDVLRARIKNQMETKRLLDERQQMITHLKNAHEIKDRLLRIVTHDLKSPLNSIRLAQYYLRGVVGNDVEAGEALDAIDDTVNTINEIIEDFLDSAALESGNPDLNLEKVQMENLLWDVIARYSITANRKNIGLLLGDSEGYALADSARLSQIVSNLVSNAIKYSPSDALVTVSSSVVGNYVRVSVADEGPGVLPDERGMLFQPFTTLSNRPTGGENSTGLGLWIVKELTRMHDGIVGADFPESGGSVFWVEIPVFLPPLNLI